jgi:hypothetical protein
MNIVKRIGALSHEKTGQNAIVNLKIVILINKHLNSFQAFKGFEQSEVPIMPSDFYFK